VFAPQPPDDRKSMKPPTEKPSESGMRFFTPELYLRFNSSDDDIADRANEEWEEALEGYGEQLTRLRSKMPSPVRELADMCFHDWDFLGLDLRNQALNGWNGHQDANLWLEFAIVSLHEKNEVISLIYTIWDHVRENEPQTDWPFSKNRSHWMYDEIDLAPNRNELFVHRILFSNGRVLEIPFRSVMIHRVGNRIGVAQ